MKLDSIKKKRKKRETVLFGAIAFVLGICVVRTYHDISCLGAVGEPLRLTAYVYVGYVMPLIPRYSVAEKRGDGDATAGERLGRKIHSYKSDCSTGCDGFSNPVISTMTILRFLVIVPPFFSLCAFHVRSSIVHRILTTRNETNRHCVPST